MEYGSRQYTLAGSASLHGIGLHTGQPVRIVFRPAPPSTGIVWRRADLPGAPVIAPEPGSKAGLLSRVVGTQRATTIGVDGVSVATVEHVMAALAGFGIDNAIVDVYGPETPFMDGSAAPFIALLEEIGTETQAAPRAWRQLRGPVVYEDEGAMCAAVPSPEVTFTYTFVSDHPALGTQFAEYGMGAGQSRETYARRFAEQIAPARTVGWLHEVESLQRRGLALGASWDCAVVVDEEKLLTPLRLPNEVARHKLLDLMGDLYLLGPLQAKIFALRSGHRHHVAFARLIAENLA